MPWWDSTVVSVCAPVAVVVVVVVSVVTVVVTRISSVLPSGRTKVISSGMV